MDLIAFLLTFLVMCAIIKVWGMFGVLPLHLVKKEVIVISRQSKLLYESANILCWFRIVVSLSLAMITEKHVIWAILFTLADFCLVIGGIIHVMDNKPMGLLVVTIVTIIDLIWQWLGKRSTDRVFTISMTTLTYVWFVLMVLTVAGVWRRNFEPYWLVGFIVTVVIFYIVWFKTRIKSRAIRRRG